MSVVPDRPLPGAALAIDSRIRVPSGWKTLDRMEVGDAITSDDGAPSSVTSWRPMGPQQAYRVTLSDGRFAECSAQHRWSVHGDGWESARKCATSELAAILPARMLWVDLPHGHFGHDDPLPLDPWMLGAVLADGAPEEPGVDLDEGGGDAAVAVAGAATRFNVLSCALARLGLSGLPREREFIPDVFLNAARRTRLAVLQGLLDTDGKISSVGGITLHVVSRRLASDVVEIVRSVGGWCRCDRSGQAFVLHIGHPNPRLVFRLSSKKNRFFSGCADRARIAVVSIEPTRIAETASLAVSHASGLFLTNDYIVSH